MWLIYVVQVKKEGREESVELQRAARMKTKSAEASRMSAKLSESSRDTRHKMQHIQNMQEIAEKNKKKANHDRYCTKINTTKILGFSKMSSHANSTTGGLHTHPPGPAWFWEIWVVLFKKILSLDVVLKT